MSVLSRFCRNRSGNFGILTALLIAPLLTVAGIAIDFSNALRVKAELSGAADVAALGSISEQSPAVIAAISQNTTGQIKAAEDAALKLFKGNWKQNNPGLDVVATATVTRTGGNFVAVINYSATVNTMFLGMVGKPIIPVSGTATASFAAAKFQRFYMLLDNSPSMGVAATQQGIDTLVNNIGCAFACHIDNNGVIDYNSNYYKARQLGVTIRIDVVASAVASLMDTATSKRRYATQFGMGIYSFGAKAESMGLSEIQTPTTDLVRAKQSAANVGLMSIPYNNYNDDQQTSFDSTFSDLSKKMGAQGSGSSAADPEKILYFVSDGLGDSYKPTGCTKALSGNRCQEPIDTKVCKAIKDKGIRIAVLYTSYLPLPTNWWYNQWIAPFQSEIPQKMKDCASPDLFFEVSPTQGISDAMNALFLKVINAPTLNS
jgi:Flp pilus assembly protein TadG